MVFLCDLRPLRLDVFQEGREKRCVQTFDQRMKISLFVEKAYD